MQKYENNNKRMILERVKSSQCTFILDTIISILLLVYLSLKMFGYFIKKEYMNLILNEIMKH